jgi:hypothetical protein
MKTNEVKFEALVELSLEAENNATSSELVRIHPPARAVGFQVAGLTDFKKYARLPYVKQTFS